MGENEFDSKLLPPSLSFLSSLSSRTWIVFLLRRSLMRATPSWHCVRAFEALKPKSQPIVLRGRGSLVRCGRANQQM